MTSRLWKTIAIINTVLLIASVAEIGRQADKYRDLDRQFYEVLYAAGEAAIEKKELENSLPPCRIDCTAASTMAALCARTPR